MTPDGAPNWQLTVEGAEATTDHWRRLPPPAITGLDAPEAYIPPQSTVDAVNVALALGQPLLLTGPPGCGKTALAAWVAHRLGLGGPLRFQTRSTAAARDLVYLFDALGRFNAARGESAGIDPRTYITYVALGEAVMRALGREKATPFLNPVRAGGYPVDPVRSVLLIDEIDKAPRDFPNDVLNELENFSFSIPELGGVEAAAPKDLLPIVIVTSNIERALPDAFLRRCVYHHMNFPTPAVLSRIVHARIRAIPPASPLVGSAVRVMTALQGLSLRKPPGTAELLAFVLALRARGFDAASGLEGRDDWIGDAMTTLVKTQPDQSLAEATLRTIAATRK